MNINRPDLTKVDAKVKAYIEYLEAENERLHQNQSRPRPVKVKEDEIPDEIPEVLEPTEPETTIHVITATVHGVAKRTPRHLYIRQRRSGMGVFDLDTPESDPPVILTLADQSQNLLLFTNLARAFRLPVSAIPQAPVHARGEVITGKLNLLPEERLQAILPDQAQGYVAMLSQSGMVRLLRHHVFGEHMKPGTSLYDYRAFGPLVSACWSSGDGDLFIVTQQGRAIRFSEKLVPPAGGLGIRLVDGDQAQSITSVYDDSGVFLLSADGRGTIRLMEGFTANKAPGAGGKIAINSDQLVAAARVSEADDIFIISKLGKIIRFCADQIPAKDGVVQGVICMTLRADEPVAIAISPALSPF